MEAQTLTTHPKPAAPAPKPHVRPEVLALAEFTQKAVKLARPEILAARLQGFLDGGTHTADELWHALTGWARPDLFRIVGLSPVLPPAPANESPQDAYRRLTQALVAAIKPLGFEIDRDHAQRWGHRWHQVSLLFQADQFQANPLGEWIVLGRHNAETGALLSPEHFRLRDEADVAIIAERLTELVG